MLFVRHLKHLPKVATSCRFVSGSNSKNNVFSKEAATNTTDEIELPNRIQRSPTDILYALSSTVGRDPTAAHYKYHDDPYLLPTSNVTKRTYAMAQEAGRKAAKWIKEEHHTLFMHKEAQPPIKDFIPKMIYTEESEVDDTALRQLIMQSEINDAVLVYNLMKQKNIEISADLKQSLLELICFYNNEEPLPADFDEERWFKEHNTARERSRNKTWKDGDLAETLFGEIEPKTAAAYAALIRGMAKYNQTERAFALFQEAIEKQFELDTTTFNSIISIVRSLKESPDQRWDFCCDLLEQMYQQQLKPDLGTLNALLQTVTSFNNFKHARNSALKVLAEFSNLGIEPSLGTYYFLLLIFCRDRSPVSHIIVDILNEIQGKEFTIRHPKDTAFFTTAMEVCRHHVHDKNIAKKLDKLLHIGKNYDLIGNSYKELIYYRNYLALLCQTESFEEFMKTYDLLVPNIYTPEPGITEEILKAVELHGAKEYMPRLWSDMVIFDNAKRDSLIMRTIKIMSDNRPNVEDVAQQKLPEQFANVAFDIFSKVSDNENRNNKLSFTGEMIGDILALLIRGNDFEKAVQIFTYIDKNQNRIPGTPSESHLHEFVDFCILNKAPSQAIICLQYSVDNQMESLKLAKKIDEGFTLNEVHLARIKSLVGDDFRKSV